MNLKFLNKFLALLLCKHFNMVAFFTFSSNTEYVKRESIVIT